MRRMKKGGRGGGGGKGEGEAGRADIIHLRTFIIALYNCLYYCKSRYLRSFMISSFSRHTNVKILTRELVMSVHIEWGLQYIIYIYTCISEFQ